MVYRVTRVGHDLVTKPTANRYRYRYRYRYKIFLIHFVSMNNSIKPGISQPAAAVRIGFIVLQQYSKETAKSNT